MPAGLHPPQAGLISRPKVRRVKRPSNREMRVRIPPLERSLRTASRHRSSPQPDTIFFAANAGRTTSLVTRQVAGSSPAGSIMGARSSVGRAGRLSKTSSPQAEYSAGKPPRTTFALVRKGLGYFPCPATEDSWRMQMGIHRWRLRPAVRVRKFSSLLVAGTDQTGECRSDYRFRPRLAE